MESQASTVVDLLSPGANLHREENAKKKKERKPSLKRCTPSLASDALDKVDLIALNLEFWEH